VDDETIGGESAGSAGIQVIARAAKVLRALESRPEGLSLAEIAQEIGLPRSTVQRIVAALAAEEFVTEAKPGRGVRIGAGLARIAASLGSNIAEILRPHLQALCEDVGETVDLSVLSGGSAIFIAQVPGRQRLVAVSAVGARFPLHCTANGKAILSCFSKPDALALIEKSLAEHPDNPLAEPARLLKEIETTRRTHLAWDIGAHTEGISAVGAAMLDVFGRPFAISIPAPSQRFASERDSLSRALTACRQKVKSLLGR
jgi:DNA-binding IclR family transcriptional regulator